VRRGDDEYDGILQILCENQIAFELTGCRREELARFPLAIVPDAGGLDRRETEALDEYVRRGGKALLTTRAPENSACFGPAQLLETRSRDQGAYVRIRPEDKNRWGQAILDKLDLVFLRGEFNIYRPGDGVEGLLGLIPPDMFGPPEKCYYRQVSDHPALLLRDYGRGTAACFTFALGAHYAGQAHQGHAALLVGAVDRLLELDRRVKVTAPPLVEVNHRADPRGRFEWISLYNHSGQRGIALHGPIPIASIEVSLMPLKPVRAVRCLRADCELPLTRHADGRVAVTVPRLELYEIVVFQFGDEPSPLGN